MKLSRPSLNQAKRFIIWQRCIKNLHVRILIDKLLNVNIKKYILNYNNGGTFVVLILIQHNTKQLVKGQVM